MQECSYDVDHSTTQRSVVDNAPRLEKVFCKKKKREGLCWRLGETYSKIKGRSRYLCRAVDKGENTVAGVELRHMLTNGRRF